ncbi:MAG TPA: alpha-L-fucosidase, partial [Phnomibacter sp.]|nr:alpha-L-fucosidase [Phnomibacter sp.]
QVRVLGPRQTLPPKVVGKISWSRVPGIFYINPVPASAQDEYITVLELTLDGPLKLYRGKGGFN